MVTGAEVKGLWYRKHDIRTYIPAARFTEVSADLAELEWICHRRAEMYCQIIRYTPRSMPQKDYDAANVQSCVITRRAALTVS